MTLRPLAIVLAMVACGLSVSGCEVAGSGTPKASIDVKTNLPLPRDVGTGHRVVYVLTDVSCDMGGLQYRQERTQALLVGAHLAALDEGDLELGVVRALASQNIDWKTPALPSSYSAQTARFRIQDALAARDRAVAQYRAFVNRSAGAHDGCSSDLVSALSQVALRQQTLNVPRGTRTDLIFVTNGLIVDRATHIVMTKQFATIKQYRQTLALMRKRYPRPDLRGINVWFVGTGWSPNITNNSTGPMVRHLWTTYLKGLGATVHIVQHSADLREMAATTQ